MRTLISQSCKLADWLGQKLQHSGWNLLGQFFQWISRYGDYAFHAYQAYTRGFFDTGVSTVAGIGTEKLVEITGKYGVDSYFIRNIK